MRWNFHGLTVEGDTPDDELRRHWQQTFASRPPATGAPRIHVSLSLTSAMPPPPNRPAHFRQGELLQYYLDGALVVAHFPRYGQLQINLADATTSGQLLTEALATYGVFEDLAAIALSPHLRRQGLFLIHAFAALHPDQKAVLLVGSIGAGKTTSGLSLLDAGWKLLSNDSPILNAEGLVMSYPGLIAAYPETYSRFASTAHLAATAGERRKRVTPAEQIWPGIWRDSAPLGAIIFPHIEAREHHSLEPISQPDALRMLLPHAVEQWDQPMIAEHLRVLRRAVETAPAFMLRLSPDVASIPSMLRGVLR